MRMGGETRPSFKINQRKEKLKYADDGTIERNE